MNLSATRGPYAALGLALLTGCNTASRFRFETEQFGSTTTHTRDFPTARAQTCEAARRALLSQGYVITLAESDHVKGRKNFQPDPEVHVEIEFHVVCAPDGGNDQRSIAFVNALQDRYALKKSNTAASVGVGAIGSLSLPFTSGDDSMVRVASQTITTPEFYDRFFALVQTFLAVDREPPAASPASSPASAATQPQP
jgi:hypothetical protein